MEDCISGPLFVGSIIRSLKRNIRKAVKGRNSPSDNRTLWIKLEKWFLKIPGTISGIFLLLGTTTILLRTLMPLVEMSFRVINPIHKE